MIKDNVTMSSGRKGMNREAHPSALQDSEYSYMRNGNIEESSGNLAMLQNEPSTLLATRFKQGYKVIGVKADKMSDNTYFFLTNPDTGYSEIGVVSGKCNYQELGDEIKDCDECNSYGELAVPLEQQEQVEGCTYKTLISDECDQTRSFNFDIYHPIKDGNIVIKDEKCGKRMYWTDNYNPPRYIDLDNLEQYKYAEDAVCDIPAKLKCEDCNQNDYVKCPNVDKMRIFPIYSHPCLEPDVVMVGGNLRKGTYEFIIAYCTKSGEEITPYMSITNPISIFDKQSVVQNQTQIADITNLGIRLSVRNLDKKYQYYKVAVIHRADVNNNTSYFVEGIHPTTEDKVYYTREGEKRITLEQLLQEKTFYERSEGLTESNNTLFQYGLTSHREWNLQPVVNFMGAFMKWGTMKADESLYEDGVNCSMYRGYMRDEVYPFAIRFITNTGYKTPIYPLIPRPAYREERRRVVPASANTPAKVREALKNHNNADIRSVNEYNPDCSDTERLEYWQYYNTAGVGTYCEAEPNVEFEFLNVNEDRKFSIKRVASFELNEQATFDRWKKDRQQNIISFKLDVSGLSARKAKELGVEKTAYNNFFEYFKILMNAVYEKSDVQELYDLYNEEGEDSQRKKLWDNFCDFVLRGEEIAGRTIHQTTFKSKVFNELMGINETEAKNQYDIGIDIDTETGCNTPEWVDVEQEEVKKEARDLSLSIDEMNIDSNTFDEEFIYKKGDEMERSYECTACRPFETDAEAEEIIKGRDNPGDLNGNDVVKHFDNYNAHDVDFMYKYADWYIDGNFTWEEKCDDDCRTAKKIDEWGTGWFTAGIRWLSGDTPAIFGCPKDCRENVKKWHNFIVRPKYIFLKRDLQQFTNVITKNCNQIVGRALELSPSAQPYENTIPFFFGNFGGDTEDDFFLKYNVKNGKTSKNIFDHSRNFSGNSHILTGGMTQEQRDEIVKFILSNGGAVLFGEEFVRNMANVFSDKGFTKGSLAFKGKFEDDTKRMFLEIVPLSKGVRNNDYHSIHIEALERKREAVRVTIFKDSTLKKILKQSIEEIKPKSTDSTDGIFIELSLKDGFRKNQYFYVVVEPSYEIAKINYPTKLTSEQTYENGVLDNARKAQLNVYRDYVGNWVKPVSTLDKKTVFRTTIPLGCFSVVLRKEEVKETKLTFSKVWLNKTVTFNFDCTHKVPVYKGCKPVDYKKGEMGYWESSFKYPDNKELYDSSNLKISTKDVPGVYEAKFRQWYGFPNSQDVTEGENTYFKLNDNSKFYCKPIRHYRMPDNVTAPFMSEEDMNPFQRSLVYPLGVELDPYVIHAFLNVAEKNGLLTNDERNSIVGYEILRGDRTLEKSIVAKGLLYDTYKYTENNKEVFYPNYPYNSLGVDTLHYNETRTNIIDHPFRSNKNNKFTFHSPETHFNKPILPREMKVETIQYGSSKGVFAPVEDHSKWVILGDKAFDKAYKLASAEVLFEKIIKAGEMAVEASKNGWFVGGFSNGGGMVGAVISAVALGLTVHQMIEQANFKRNKLQYEWEKIFIDKGEPINFASYYTSTGWYNFVNPDFEGNTNMDIPNGAKIFQGNSLRGLAAVKYLKPGRYSITENGANASYRFNNFQRESTVMLSMGKDERNCIKYSNVFSTYDNLDKDGNFLSSRDTAGSRGIRTGGISRELTSQIASMYVQLRNYVPGQYGNIDSVQWLPTGYCNSLKLQAGTNSKMCTTIYGGDIFISRFSLKRKQPMFIANAIGLAPLTPFSYTKQMNIGRAKFYADYLVTSELDVGSGLMPSLRSNINFDTDRRGTAGMYVEAPARFYLFYYGIPQFLVESEINCNFRYAKKEWHENFYPEVGDYIEWTQEKNVSIKKDNEFHYNFAYSKNTTQTGGKKLPAIYEKKKWDCLNDAPNGVIASQQDGSEQDLSDPYLIYKPLDFYQFPTSYGKLIDMRGIDVATVLARFENTSAIFTAVDTTQNKAATPNNYLIGTGGIFAQKPQLLSANELGYAGTQHKALVGSEAGYFWTDAKRGQVFAYNGKGVEDISEGMRNWFKEQLPFKMLNKRGDETVLDLDNPFLHHGISMGWDSRYRRLFLTKLDYVAGEKKPKEVEQTVRRYEKILNVKTKQTIVDETNPKTYKEVEKVRVTFEEDRSKPMVSEKKSVEVYPSEPFYFFYNGEKLLKDLWRDSSIDKSYLTNPPSKMYNKKAVDDYVVAGKEKVEGDNEKVFISSKDDLLSVLNSKKNSDIKDPDVPDRTSVFVFVDVSGDENTNPLLSQGDGGQKFREILTQIIKWCYSKYSAIQAPYKYEGKIYLFGRCSDKQNFFTDTINLITDIPENIFEYDYEEKDGKTNKKDSCSSSHKMFKSNVLLQNSLTPQQVAFAEKYIATSVPNKFNLVNSLVVSIFNENDLLGQEVELTNEGLTDIDDLVNAQKALLEGKRFVKVSKLKDYDPLSIWNKNKNDTDKIREAGGEKKTKELLWKVKYEGGVLKEGADSSSFIYTFRRLKEVFGDRGLGYLFKHLLIPVSSDKHKNSSTRLLNSLFALENANVETFDAATLADYQNNVGVEDGVLKIVEGDKNPYYFTDVPFKKDEYSTVKVTNHEKMYDFSKGTYKVDYNLKFDANNSYKTAGYLNKLNDALDQMDVLAVREGRNGYFNNFSAGESRPQKDTNYEVYRELEPLSKETKWEDCKDCPPTYPKKVVTTKYKVKEPITYEEVTENVIMKTLRVRKTIWEYERKEDASFTLAYSPLTKSWISYYDFKPAYYVNHHNYFQTGINYGKDDSEFGLWSHLLTNKSYQVFYGKFYPFTIELPIKEVYSNRILKNVEYWLESRRYHNNYDYAEGSKVGFSKAWVYNNTNNSGQLNLFLAEKNNRYQQLQFPKIHSDSMDILVNNEDKKWTFNYFFNQVKSDRNNLPIWNYDVNAIEKKLNMKALSYNQRMQDRLRGDWFFVRLSQDKESRYKTIFKWLSVQETLYN